MLERYAYLFWLYRHVRRFLADTRRGRAVQQEVLLEKIRRNEASEFGRERGFAEIRSVEDFRRRMPVTTYEDYRPYIERVKQGEFGAMFGPCVRLLMFAMTSGTTAEPKYLPVTESFFDEYRRGWNLWGLKLYRDHLDLVRKKTIKLASDWQQTYTPGGTACGNISGLVEQTSPRAGRSRFILPAATIKIHNPRAKHYTALRLALASRRIGLIGTANPSTLVEFARLANAERDRLIRDIHNGTLCREIDVPHAVREALSKRIARRDPRRARELEAIVERTGQLLPRDAWPQLSVVAVWMGGSVGVYLPLVKHYYGEIALRDHGLSGSEAHMTIPIEDGTTAGVLEYLHHFFEFIPEEEHESRRPTVLEAHELEVGRNYYILLTTSAGLYRYDIHDVVRCVGYRGEVPLLEFLNKGSHFSSITGEKLTEAQVVAAVGGAMEELGLVPEPFTVAPIMADRLRYVLLLEPGPHAACAEQLVQRIDVRLAASNCEYANRLETGRIEPLSIREIPRGTWAAFRARRISARGNLEEYKHPCLVGDLQFVDRLLENENAR